MIPEMILVNLTCQGILLVLLPINKLDLSLTNSMLCRFLVESARARGLEVIDRCNLTVLLEPGQEHLAQYLADNQVTALLSLRHFLLTAHYMQRQRFSAQQWQIMQSLQVVKHMCGLLLHYS